MLFFANLVPWPSSWSACALGAVQHGAGRGGNWLLGAEQLRWLHTVAGQRLQERCCVAEGLLLLRMSGAVLLSIPLRLHALSSSELCVWLVLCRYKSLKAFPGGTVVCKHVCITLEVTQAVQVINPPFCTDDCFFFFSFTLCCWRNALVS